MSDKTTAPAARKFWLVDILVLVIFISTAILGLYLFRRDLMQTLDARDAEPVGLIIIRNNVVQRRHDDRVLWDRLYVDSPVYSGDLIRAADISSATIFLDENQININENTLIRIQHLADGMGSFNVELREGNLSLVQNIESMSIILEVMGRQVQAEGGGVINAGASEEGISIQVTEGTATFMEEGKVQELSEGTMVARDPSGRERIIPAAVVTRPLPNASYLKSGYEPLPVDFSWRRINLSPSDALRLELAWDRNFTQGLQVYEDLNSYAQAEVDTGIWHWRLLFDGAVLRAGQFTVADASAPALLSPVMNSVFRYSEEHPQIRFQWQERKGASYYILEVSHTSDFFNPHISRQLETASFVSSVLGEGTWYWRVFPVFSSAYIGSSESSYVSSFEIEQTSDESVPAIEVPDPVAAAAAPSHNISEAPQSQSISRPSVTVTIPESAAPAAASSLSASPSPASASASVPPRSRMSSVRRYAQAPEGGVVQVARPQVETAAVQPALSPQVQNSAVSVRHYVVQPGDTLASISWQHYGNHLMILRIVEVNNVSNLDLIYPDQVLVIP